VKKSVRILATAWCALCGLVVPPALLAVALAQGMGILDLRPIVAKLQGTSIEGSAEAGVERNLGGIPPEDLATPIDAFAWRRRLQALGAGVGADADQLATERVEFAAREAEQRELAGSLAALVGDLTGAPVSAEAILEEPNEWRARLAARREADQARPRLLKMLQNVENEALASILANPDASNGLDEDTVARLMEELPPARAGEVITELGRRNPAFASRILARLERTSVLPDSEGVSPR
jgi:hypothetical protein